MSRHPPPAEQPLQLLPRPRLLVQGAARVPGPFLAPPGLLERDLELPGWLQLELRPEARELGAEGYRLRVAPPPEAGGPVVWIEAHTRTGLWQGRRTLAQLLRQHSEALPALEIEDSPSFAVRGVMLDISRDRVPTMASLLEAVELLASWKVNHLQLYMEHTFAYAGHEVVWEGWSPLTGEEVRTLDERCRELGIDLVPNQNCFGHLTRWLVHEPYRQLAETQEPWDFLGHPREEPFSLCPGDPGSRALVEDLLDQLLPCFSSTLVNIGCDETFDVGQGRSRAAVQRRGLATVYLEFVDHIHQVVRRHGCRALLWADMLLRHPRCLQEVPAEMIPLVWGYEPDTPFLRWLEQLRAAERTAWVCPGTSSWQSITGRSVERRANLEVAARAARAQGMEGYLVTDWGDHGHRQQWPISWLGLAEGADAAWNDGQAGKTDPRAPGLHALGDPTGAAGVWLHRLGDVDHELRLVVGPPAPDGEARPLRNATALFRDLDTPLDGEWRPGEVTAWQRVEARLEELAGSFPEGAGEVVAEELRHTLREARLAAHRAVLRRQPHPPDRQARQQLREERQALMWEHRRLWLRRCRPGGLEDSLSCYRDLDRD